MHSDAYTGVLILIVGFIIINNYYILKEFIFKEKRLNEISENKFSSKITRCTVCVTFTVDLYKTHHIHNIFMWSHASVYIH